jgi:hypothetical protein
VVGRATTVLAMPFDLVRHDLLMDLKPLETRAHALHRRRALPAPRAIRLAENDDTGVTRS